MSSSSLKRKKPRDGSGASFSGLYVTANPTIMLMDTADIDMIVKGNWATIFSF
jgi:hypothetical protein